MEQNTKVMVKGLMENSSYQRVKFEQLNEFEPLNCESCVEMGWYKMFEMFKTGKIFI